jgi:hypothetical protein
LNTKNHKKKPNSEKKAKNKTSLYRKCRNTPIYAIFTYVEEEDQQWLLPYDFEGIKPGTKFYTNLARLSALKGETELIQYSALLTGSRRVALAARNLKARAKS